MTTTSSESLADTLCAVAIGAVAAWWLSTTRRHRAVRRPVRRRDPLAVRTPTPSPAMAVESDWEEFDRETAELEALRHQRRSDWSHA